MALIASTLDHIFLIPYLLTHKTSYSVSIRPNNYFSTFNFNPASFSLYKTSYISFRLSTNEFSGITSTYYIYAYTISNP